MYEISEELIELAKKVMQEHEDVSMLKDSGCRIAYLYSDRSKKRGGKIVYADAEKLSDKVKALANYDFAITFYKPECAGKSEDKLKMLMWHELKHIGYSEDGTCKIIPHDIEDFADIVNEYGTQWIE